MDIVWVDQEESERGFEQGCEEGRQGDCVGIVFTPSIDEIVGFTSFPQRSSHKHLHNPQSTMIYHTQDTVITRRIEKILIVLRIAFHCS